MSNGNEGQIGYLTEISQWESLRRATQAAAAGNAAVAQTAKNYEAHYEAELDRTNKMHQRKIDVMQTEFDAEKAVLRAEILQREATVKEKELALAQLDIQFKQKEVELLRTESELLTTRTEVKKGKLSSYNYQMERDALLLAVQEQFGDEVVDDMIDKMHTTATEVRLKDAKEGFPMLAEHELNLGAG
ncbi:MAG: hypothetical protein ACXWT1_16045 [Methylobacter sp.]